METFNKTIIILISFAILILITFFIICIIWISSLRYTLKRNKSIYSTNIAYVDFKKFLDYYKLNPDIYNLEQSIWCPYRENGWLNNIIIHFNNFTDHFRYYFWAQKELKYLNKIKENKNINKCTEKYLQLVLQDVENIKPKE